MWTILKLVGFRWTINDILAQPEGLLDDVVTIEWLARRVEEDKNDAA